VGQGTTITFRIPRRTAPLLTGERATLGTRSSQQSMIAPNRLSGLIILLVEDDPDSREIIRLTLHTYGAEIIESGCAAEAMEQLRQRVPDVLISDIGLPEEDGFSLIRRVRNLPPHQGGFVPALALTAFARPSDSDRAIQEGFHQHLAKPAAPAALVEAVAHLAGRR
jgi:CheY-like chemotaxis protein